MNQIEDTKEEMKIWQKIGFFSGPILFFLMLFFLLLSSWKVESKVQ